MDELLLALKVIAAVYQFMDTVNGLLNPDPATLRDVYNELVGLEADFIRLENYVENASYELRRGEAINITRAVDAQRAAYTAALEDSMDHPGDTAGEIIALAAANALASPSFYTFPGRTAGSPDRFDPRSALPSFVEAVGVWLSLRKLNKARSTTASKNSLIGFASRLDDIVARIRASVTCFETYASYDRALTSPPRPRRIPRPVSPDPQPEPAPIPTEPRCSHIITCIDAMREATTYLLDEQTAGYCGEDGSFPNVEQANRYLDSYYEPDKLQAIAQSWRAIAN